MLVEFGVENYRSLRKGATLSMVASSDKTSLPDNLVTGVLKDDSLLRSAIIYGANASGKTNVLRALNFFKMLVMQSATHQKGAGIIFEPFKLDLEARDKPTKMHVVFMKNEKKFIYDIAYNKERIIYEYLHIYKSNRPLTLFERFISKGDIKDFSGKDPSKFSKINEYYYYFSEPIKKQKEIADKTNENTLYLSKTRTENLKETDDIYGWFHELILISPENINEDFTLQLAEKNEEYRKRILTILNIADFAISDFKSETKEVIGFENFPEQIKRFLAQNPHFRPSDNRILQRKFSIFHKNISFDFTQEESEGTKRMFNIIGPIIDAIESGKVIVFDELDVKLHPELQKYILSLFHNPEQNKKNAQLICTTHNTNLLDQDLIRRDQIWFTEKNPETCQTGLYSLLEFSPRKDKNLERGYLTGRYGALPFIKDEKVF